MVVAAAGAVEHAAIVAEVEKRFASFRRTGGARAAAGAFRGRQRFETRDLEQVHIALALQGLPQRDRQLYSLQVFTNVLGGGMSSRLFQEVREKRGLCYAIYAFHMPYSDTGMFGLYAGTDAADAPELMRVVVDEIGNAAETLNEAEVARAKAQMKAGLLMALESSGARVEQLARQMFAYGRPIPLDEIVAQGRGGDGRQRARRRPHADQRARRPAIAALGPGKGLESDGRDRRKSGAAGGLNREASVRPWRFSAPSICNEAMPRDRAATASRCACRRAATMPTGRNCARPAASFSRRGSRPGRPTISRAAPSAAGCGATPRTCAPIWPTPS